MCSARKGFTLLEILVVIAIIGILASIIIFAIDKAKQSSRDAQRLSDMREVSGALELYYSDNGQYPALPQADLAYPITPAGVARDWSDMLAILSAGQYLARAEKIQEQQTQQAVLAESPLQRFVATILSPFSVAYASSATLTIQDPLYSASNPGQSYGYMPSANTNGNPNPPYHPQNYRLRAKLENTSSSALKQSLDGKFLYTDETPDPNPNDPYNQDTCDSSLGYYCTGPSQNFNAFNPGKPVIYLYPTTKTDVSVTIDPLHIDASVPQYGDGWHVTAYPDGTLINDSDGAKYPYLYWEGESNQPIVDRATGFVVATADLGAFLKTSLAAQGLQGKEITDFIAYWQPLMAAAAKGDPYIYVYYMPQPVYDTLVPMTITPAPQTLIRVYLLYKPLAAPISVTPEVLSAPKRVGFTAVEWGGNRSPLQ
jgi:prepilin-type N-terminal cleavage/methylation domain-containing protein